MVEDNQEFGRAFLVKHNRYTIGRFADMIGVTAPYLGDFGMGSSGSLDLGVLAFDLGEEDSLKPRDRQEDGSTAAVRIASAADLSPFQIIAESVTAEGGKLVEQVSALIDQTQAFTASHANATLTLRN